MFLEGDSDDNELFDDANDDATTDSTLGQKSSVESAENEDQNGGSSNTLSGAAVVAPGGMFEDPFKTQTPGPPGITTSDVKIDKRAKKSRKTTKNAKICPKLTNRGEKCDKDSDCRVQFSHPFRCRHFAKFGIVSDFPQGKGCNWEVKCRFAHVKVCKRSTCPKMDCNLTHLQPKPKSQSRSQVNHKGVRQNSKSVSVGRKSNSVRSARSDAVPGDPQAALGMKKNGGSRNEPSSQHQPSRGSFLGQPSLHPQGIDSIEELAKMVTQMVIQSFNSISSSNNNYMQQSQPQMWVPRYHH
jgi:hypothetical protein